MTAIAPAVRVEHRGRPDRSADRSGVAWLTVLPLAALMAYADGFWVMSLREAVGAIERTDSPFQLAARVDPVLPVFVVAVLAATSMALHRFGPSPRRPGRW